jgi:DNA-binding NarL/FixJ family response regulator
MITKRPAPHLSLPRQDEVRRESSSPKSGEAWRGDGFVADRSAGAIKLLIADDHPMVLRGIIDCFKLERDILIVAACSDGADALARINSLSPDVAMLDMSMPAMNGLNVLAEVNKAGIGTRILLFSAAASPRDVIMAIAEGAYGFLPKDSAPSEILHAIREIAVGRKCIPFELLARERADKEPLRDASELLTDREWDVLALAADGLSNKEIARQLNVTLGTAKIHLHHIFRKTGVRNRTELASLALRIVVDRI